MSNDASDKEGYEKKYGTDISFELTDKTKMSTTEIGNIGMVIDKMDDDGRISWRIISKNGSKYRGSKWKQR